MNTRDHQNTQDTFTQAATHLQQAASSPEQIYQRAKDQVLDAADAVLNARKIVLSQAGIVRVLIESPGGKIRTGDNTRKCLRRRFPPKSIPRPRMKTMPSESATPFPV